MDLVNLMYSYINRFINSDNLLKNLIQVNLSEYSNDEKTKIKQLIQDTKKEVMKSIEKQYNKLLIEKQTVRDGEKLYENIFDLLTNNVLINK